MKKNTHTRQKALSVLLAALMTAGSAAAALPVIENDTAITVSAAETAPEMPAEVAARYAQHRNHSFSWEDIQEENYRNKLIMPGDTVEIPVVETDGGTIEFIGSMAGDGNGNITNDPFFYIDLEGDDNWSTLPSDIYLPDGFEVTGAVEPVAERTYTRSFQSSSGSFTVKFCEQWVNNTNCPFTLIYKGGGSGPLGNSNNQVHALLQVMFMAPNYKITYPESTEEGSNDGLDRYFWPQGRREDLDFPQYYWITDTPYTITFPNPVQKKYHFDYWASEDATQSKNGQYTDVTVCYTEGTNSHGNNYSGSSFKGYGDAKAVPVFTSGTTLTLDGNGGKINGLDEWIIETPANNVVSDNYGYDLEDHVPVKDGDTFLGWCEKQNARYDSFVTKDDESEICNKFWNSEYDRNYRYANVTLYAKWASNTKEALEKNGWEIDDDGTLWLLNNDGVEAWNAARNADPTLAPGVRGIKQSFNNDDPSNGFAFSLEGVFDGCVNLENLVFEENVRWLNWSAFKDCVNLKTITFLDEIYNSLDNVMIEAPKDVVVTVPETYKGRLGKYDYLADNEIRYDLTVNGKLITENNLTVQCGAGTATFDPASNTLTLENAELSECLHPHWQSIYSDPETYTRYTDAAIVSDLPELKVVLKGENTVTSANLEAFRAYGDLSITGDGSIKAHYTLSNYFIIDSETGESVPVSAVFPLTLTALGSLELDGITAKRMNVSPKGSLTIRNADIIGGILTPEGSTSISGSKLHQFTGGVSGSYDRGNDYTPTIGGKNITVENSKFDYVTVSASEDAEEITFRDSEIQLSDKLTAGSGTKLTIDNTVFKAYGQSDGVTNISEEKITLTGCEITQGAWDQRGYFSITPKEEPVVEPEPQTFALSSVQLSEEGFTYDGKEKTPDVTVTDENGKTVDAENYSVQYSDNINAGAATVTVTGKGKYTGTVSRSFNIFKADISKLSAALSTESYTYDGKAKKPAVTVKSGNTTLKNKTDYTVGYKNNTKKGKASVTITGKGNYSGAITKTFTIKAKSIAKLSASLAASSYAYNGKAKKPAVTLKDGKTTLKKDTDYTVGYSSNKAIGTAKVTIKGKGNYSGTITKTFKIVPKTATLKTVSSPRTKQLKASWAKDTTATGYQLQYSTSSSFKSGNKTKLIKSNKTTSSTITGLKKGKTYYVRVRAYKTVSGTKIYGDYSKTKKVKIK